jgi:glycosyltransferase involved in cell wall biosynthesis
MDPLITIVLPTFNGSRYIASSIESCIKQTFRNFELIIVNDCSTDSTKEIIEQYAASDNRIRVIHNEFNKKLPLSLNTGFDLGVGSYFTWTSDDNIYGHTALEVMVTELENEKDIDLIYCDYNLIDENGKLQGKVSLGDVNESFNKWIGAGACFLYRRKIHKVNNGYNPAAFLIEDYDFFVRAFTKFTFKYLKRSDLYYYREHESSLTNTQRNNINDISKIFLERNLVALEGKLSKKESGLLFRKLAVYHAVTKNDSKKYVHYLSKLKDISAAKTLVTVLYVIAMKFKFAIQVGFSGIVFLFKSIFR